MNKIGRWTCFIILVAASLCSALEFDPDEFMAVEELRPGMRGYGLTVFSGTKIDTFQVEILGVDRNSQWPKRDLIWTRLEGQQLQKTGVPKGVSGSPVYVGGRLIGAVGYGFPYTSEPLAAITPIGEMIEMLKVYGRSGDGIHDDMPDQDFRAQDEMQDALGQLLAGQPAFPSTWVGVEQTGVAPLAVPLMVGGIGDPAFAALRPVFEQMGFLPLQAGGVSLSSVDSPELQPGSGVGVQYMRGDLNMVAVGTLTYRRENQVLAFGHPYRHVGDANWPMTTVDVHFVVPNLISSFKYASSIDVVGTVTQDRQSGIAGTVGEIPAMTAAQLLVSGEGIATELNLEMINDRALTPVLAWSAVLSAIGSVGNLSGEQTVRLSSKLEFAGGRIMRLENAFSGTAAPFAAGLSLYSTLSQLLSNPFEPVRVEKLSVELALEENVRTSALEGIRVNKAVVLPGEELTVTMRLRPHLGRVAERSVKLRLPEDVPHGTVELRVSDAGAARALDVRQAPARFRAKNLDELIGILEEAPRNDELVIDLFLRRTGATVGAVELPSLPVSMASVLSSSRQAGEAHMTQGTNLIRQRVEMEQTVTGRQSLQLRVKRNGR